MVTAVRLAAASSISSSSSFVDFKGKLQQLPVFLATRRKLIGFEVLSLARRMSET